ncbi:MAG: hypothetical protein ABH841_00950 [Candidatus Nealsonbacteria bacterium]
MNKKILFGIGVLFLCLVCGGVFYWWQNQADVRALNTTLPEGVKIVKSLIGNEYRLVNKIDGYEFKIPPELIKLKEVKYYEEKDSNGISLESMNEEFLGVGVYKINATDIDLESWVDDWMNKFETFSWTKEKDEIGDFKTIILKEKEYFSGGIECFFKKTLKFYSISSPSEEFIRYIIANGKW